MPPSAIILVIDRLGAGYLGPYGNTWLETPAFNRLAARSLLCEQVLASSPELTGTYRDYWFGSNGMDGSLLQRAQTAGYHSVLVTDEPELKQLPGAVDFDELHFVSSPERTNRLAEEANETSFAALLDLALAQLATWQEATKPQLLWIHASSLNSLWDAPLELRDQFGDEDDPVPSTTVTPPELRIEPNHDPDELLSLSHAYAGQVALVDWGLDSLLDAIDQLPQRDDLLLAFTSPRGYPLGEHGRVGRCDDAIYSELLHVPLLVQFPQQEGALRRTQELIQPASLHATFLDVLSCDADSAIRAASLQRLIRSEPFAHHRLAIATAEKQRVIRSAAWLLRTTTSDAGDQHELFTKPDDRWDFNDVANRATDIVELLLKQAGQNSLAPMPEELVSPWR